MEPTTQEDAHRILGYKTVRIQLIVVIKSSHIIPYNLSSRPSRTAALTYVGPSYWRRPLAIGFSHLIHRVN